MGTKRGLRAKLSIPLDNSVSSSDLNTFDVYFFRSVEPNLRASPLLKCPTAAISNFFTWLNRARAAVSTATIFGETIIDFNVATSAALFLADRSDASCGRHPRCSEPVSSSRYRYRRYIAASRSGGRSGGPRRSPSYSSLRMTAWLLRGSSG